jgi:hypothetical protein
MPSVNSYIIVKLINTNKLEKCAKNRPGQVLYSKGVKNDRKLQEAKSQTT